MCFLAQPVSISVPLTVSAATATREKASMRHITTTSFFIHSSRGVEKAKLSDCLLGNSLLQGTGLDCDTLPHFSQFSKCKHAQRDLDVAHRDIEKHARGQHIHGDAP